MKTILNSLLWIIPAVAVGLLIDHILRQQPMHTPATEQVGAGLAPSPKTVMRLPGDKGFAGYDVVQFTVDGCEYLAIAGSQRASMIHKANCTNHVALDIRTLMHQNAVGK